MLNKAEMKGLKLNLTIALNLLDILQSFTVTQVDDTGQELSQLSHTNWIFLLKPGERRA